MTRCSRWVRKSCYCVLGRLVTLYSLQNTSRKMSSSIRWGMVSGAAESLWKVNNKKLGLHITSYLGANVFRSFYSFTYLFLSQLLDTLVFSLVLNDIAGWQPKCCKHLVSCTSAVVLKFLRSNLHIQINRSVSKWRGFSLNASYIWSKYNHSVQVRIIALTIPHNIHGIILIHFNFFVYHMSAKFQKYYKAVDIFDWS